MEGVNDVARALRNGTAKTVVIAEPTEAVVWVGDAPTDVAAERDDLQPTMNSPISCRADEALPCAAVASGAEVDVTVRRSGLRDGVGATFSRAPGRITNTM